MKQRASYTAPSVSILSVLSEDLLTLSEQNASHGESISWNDKLEIC